MALPLPEECDHLGVGDQDRPVMTCPQCWAELEVGWCGDLNARSLHGHARVKALAPLETS